MGVDSLRLHKNEILWIIAENFSAMIFFVLNSLKSQVGINEGCFLDCKLNEYSLYNGFDSGNSIINDPIPILKVFIP